jgi:hypothetical protein
MVEQPIEVDVQIAGRNVPAGRLWTHRHGQSESATFSYRDDYLQRADAYELDPGLPLQGGQHQTPVKRPLFGAMSDCARTAGDGVSSDARRDSGLAKQIPSSAGLRRSTSCSARATTCARGRCDFAATTASSI